MSAAGALALLLLQAAPPSPPSPEPVADVVYVRGPWRPPQPSDGGETWRLVDLGYSARDEAGTTHAFEARLRFRDRAYLAFESEGERRGVALETARAVLRLSEEDGSWRGFTSWRARRLLAELDLHRRAGGSGLVASALLAGRLSSDAELVARFVGDTRPEPRRPELRQRFPRAVSLGLLWQRGASFEAFAEAAHSRVRTEGGLEYERDEAALDAAGAWGGAEIEAGIGYARERGRFPRRQWRAGAAARVPLFGRLLAEAGTRQRFEPGLQRVDHSTEAALGLHARRVRLPRAGESARRAADLARHATARGRQERRVFGAGERLEQRRRLSLGPQRAEFRDETLALHRAEVDERLVPLLGVDFGASQDALLGLKSRRYGLSIGVPWPLAWPWRALASAAPFLRLHLSRRRDAYASGLVAFTDAIALEADLSRETTLAARWSRPDPAPLDLLTNRGRAHVVELSYTYRLGR